MAEYRVDTPEKKLLISSRQIIDVDVATQRRRVYYELRERTRGLVAAADTERQAYQALISEATTEQTF